MKKLLLFSIYFCSASISFAQQFKMQDSIRPFKILKQTDISGDTKICICCRDRGDTSGLPLTVINNIFTINDARHFIIDPNTIEDIKILNQVEAYNSYGDKAKLGAILMKINDTAKLIGLEDLLEYFHIDLKDRSLPICVDEDFLTYPLKIQADVTAVKKIIVTEGKYWYYTNQIPVPRKFIDIVTK